jgi:hypothetical protein
MRRKHKKRSRARRRVQVPVRDGIGIDAADAPEEGSDAGDDAALRLAFVGSSIQARRKLARRHLQNAMRLASRARDSAEAEARMACDLSARAFWWAEDTPMEDAQHALMHEIGRYTRTTFGCQIPFENGSYSHRCPIRIAHKRMGASVGYIATPICSICGEDLSECPHRQGRTYWVRGGVGPSGHCPVCLGESECGHKSDRLYRVGVARLITQAELREVSWVDRPAQPEARLTALPIDNGNLQYAFGPKFAIGMPLSCDFCLNACDGIEEPFRDLTLSTEDEPGTSTNP